MSKERKSTAVITEERRAQGERRARRGAIRDAFVQWRASPWFASGIVGSRSHRDLRRAMENALLEGNYNMASIIRRLLRAEWLLSRRSSSVEPTNEDVASVCERFLERETARTAGKALAEVLHNNPDMLLNNRLTRRAKKRANRAKK